VLSPTTSFSLFIPLDRDTRFRAVLDSPEAAMSAVTHVEHNPIFVNGSELQLFQQQDISPSADLYVTDFPESTGRAELADALGVPTDIVGLQTGRNGPFANVTFANVEEAKEAMARFAVSPIKIDGHALDVSYSRRALLAARLHVSGRKGTLDRKRLATALGVAPDAVIPPNLGSTYMHAQVQLPSAEAAEAIMTRHRTAPVTIDGVALNLELASRPPVPPCSRLTFIGLSDDVETLRKLLAPIESKFMIDGIGQGLHYPSNKHAMLNRNMRSEAL
jgi:hypothetical protein